MAAVIPPAPSAPIRVDPNADLVGFQFHGADCTITVLGTNRILPQYLDVLVEDHDSGKEFESVRAAGLVRARKAA